MSRMSQKKKAEWGLFLNRRNRFTYNQICRKCKKDCKQSFRATVIECPQYKSRRSKRCIFSGAKSEKIA